MRLLQPYLMGEDIRLTQVNLVLMMLAAHVSKLHHLLRVNLTAGLLVILVFMMANLYV
jgi:hypothetical protein